MVVGQQREAEEVVVDQAAVPGQSQVEAVEHRVEEVQETMDIHQQPLVFSQPEDMTAGSSSQKAAPVVSGTARFRYAALPGQV